MPSSLNSSGRMRTAASLKTNVLKKDIAAETPPLFRAVKNDEANMFMLARGNMSEKIRKP